MVIRGTITMLMPRPYTMFGQTILAMATSSVTLPNISVAAAIQATPTDINHLAST